MRVGSCVRSTSSRTNSVFGDGGWAVIQAPRKSNGIEISYEHQSAFELAKLHHQLRQVREWADSGEWRESGSDGLYAILQELKDQKL